MTLDLPVIVTSAAVVIDRFWPVSDCRDRQKSNSKLTVTKGINRPELCENALNTSITERRECCLWNQWAEACRAGRERVTIDGAGAHR